MKIFFIVFLLIINIVIINSIVYAKQSDEFVNFLSETIYNDCNNHEIIIKENSLLDLRKSNDIVLQTDNYKKEVIYSKYDTQLIKNIIEIFSSREPYGRIILINGEKKFADTIIPRITVPFDSGESLEVISDGRDILKCNNNILDISGTDYLWNNQRIELPKNTVVNIDKFSQNNITLFGISLMSNGGLTVFSFTLFGFSIFGGISFLVLSIKFIKFIFRIIIKKNKKSK